MNILDIYATVESVALLAYLVGEREERVVDDECLHCSGGENDDGRACRDCGGCGYVSVPVYLIDEVDLDDMDAEGALAK